MTAEPKSGKLYKLSSTFLGPRWKEKWVHLDGTILKYFPMASDQSRFTLTPTLRQQDTLELAEYNLVSAEPKKVDGRFIIQLISTDRSTGRPTKTTSFACASDKEQLEWKQAFEERLQMTKDKTFHVNPGIAGKLRAANKAFNDIAHSQTNQAEPSHLEELLKSIRYEGDPTEFSQRVQDRTTGKIQRERFLESLKLVYESQENQFEALRRPESTRSMCLPRRSFRKPSYESKESVISQPQNQQDTSSYTSTRSRPSASSSALSTLDRPLNTCQKLRATLRISSDGELESTLTHGISVSAILSSFRESAEQLVTQIVEEMVADGNMKRLIPLDMSNDQFLATDDMPRIQVLHKHLQKFVNNGLTAYILYEPHTSVGEALRKLLGNEMRAVKWLHETIQSKDTNLYVPLQCCVDYLGFRAFVFGFPTQQIRSARQELPTPQRSRRKGDTERQLAYVLKEIGTVAIPSKSDDSVSELSTPATIGFSPDYDEIAIQNVGDIAPPDWSSLAHEDDSSGQDPRIWRQRLELVTRFGTSLASDEETNVKSSSDYLHQVAIPNVIAHLEAHTPTPLFDTKALVNLLHNEGVNARHLGRCFETAKLKHARRLLATEMLARVCKVEYRRVLRSLILKKHAIEENKRRWRASDLQKEVKKSTVSFLNKVMAMQTKDSKQLWSTRLLPHTTGKFSLQPNSLTMEIIERGELIHPPQLLLALQYHLGIKLRDVTSFDFNSKLPVDPNVLKGIIPITTMPLRTSAACERKIASIPSMKTEGNLDMALACVKFQLAIADTSPRDERTASICSLLTSAADLSQQLGLIDQTTHFLKLAIDDSPLNNAERVLPLTMSMRLEHSKGDINRSKEQYAKAVSAANWHLGKSHPLLLETYLRMVDILYHDGDVSGALKSLNNCVSLARECYSKNNLYFADMRRIQGMLLVEAKASAESIAVLEEAVDLYETLATKECHDEESVQACKTKAANCLVAVSNVYQQSGQKSSAYTVALRALAIRKDVLRYTHNDILQSYLDIAKLAMELDDPYRAIEFYKAATNVLRNREDDTDSLQQLSSVTQSMLQIYLAQLEKDKQDVIESTQSTFASFNLRFSRLCKEGTMMYQLDSPSNRNASPTKRPREQGDLSLESQLLGLVVHQLMNKDATEYLDKLLEATQEELVNYRFQSQVSVARRHTIDTNAHASATKTLPPPKRSSLTSTVNTSIGFEKLDADAMLLSPSGDFNNSGQLAAVLFLLTMQQAAC